jgi:hypothetical protein
MWAQETNACCRQGMPDAQLTQSNLICRDPTKLISNSPGGVNPGRFGYSRPCRVILKRCGMGPAGTNLNSLFGTRLVSELIFMRYILMGV